MTDRATSTTLGYVLTLAIATTLVTGLLVAGGDFVGDRREQVIRQELRVIGEHVGSNVETADRLAEAGDGGTVVELNQSFPERVTGSTYRVRLVPDGPTTDPHVWLNATRPSVSVRVNVSASTPLQASTAGGGELSVVLDGGNLVIRNA